MAKPNILLTIVTVPKTIGREIRQYWTSCVDFLVTPAPEFRHLLHLVVSNG